MQEFWAFEHCGSQCAESCPCHDEGHDRPPRIIFAEPRFDAVLDGVGDGVAIVRSFSISPFLYHHPKAQFPVGPAFSERLNDRFDDQWNGGLHILCIKIFEVGVQPLCQDQVSCADQGLDHCELVGEVLIESADGNACSFGDVVGGQFLDGAFFQKLSSSLQDRGDRRLRAFLTRGFPHI